MNARTRPLLWVGTGLSALLLLGPSHAPAAVASRQSADHIRAPVFRVSNEQPVSDEQPTAASQEPAVAEHPLLPAIRYAKAGLVQLDQRIQDYSCTMIKRERIGGTLNDHEYIFVKVRHRPFSVYMYFLGPQAIKGRECIYVEGRNNGKLIAHEGTGFKAKLGVFRLDPNGVLDMRGQRYPISEVGVRMLTTRLIEVAELDTQYGECEVKWFKGTKVDNRKCTCIQVIHPTPRKEFRFHLARIFIDDEMQFPIRYESYQWPKREGGQPVLDEEYTYVNMKVNNGFTDADFEERNPSYRFQ